MSKEKCCDKCYGEITETIFPPGAKYYGCTLKQECSCHTPSTDTMEERFKKIFVREDGLLGIGKYDKEVVLDFINAEISYFLQKRNEELVRKVQKLEEKIPARSRNDYEAGEHRGIEQTVEDVLNIIQQP
jgi:hypothetical protein